MRRIFSVLLVAIIPTLFCSLMSSPFSYSLPLNCPQGSKVIGIECFDENYNNTTPWYRLNFGASELTFPFWLMGFTAISAYITFRKPSVSAAEDVFDGYKYKPVAAQPVVKPAPSISAKSKNWLPTNCPHCGGSISTQSVEWVSNFEAKCPYCASVLKQ